MKIRVGLIRVISVSEPEQLFAHQHILECAYPQLKVITRAIEGFPHGLYTKQMERKAIPEIIRLGKELSSCVEVVGVSCTADPGVGELRSVISVPVVGAGTALGLIARTVDDKIGVMTIGSRVPEAVAATLEGCTMVWKRVKGVKRTTDLHQAETAIVETASWLAAAGFRVIALACTGFSTVGAASLISKAVPSMVVVDPVLALGATLVGVFTSAGVRG